MTRVFPWFTQDSISVMINRRLGVDKAFPVQGVPSFQTESTNPRFPDVICKTPGNLTDYE